MLEAAVLGLLLAGFAIAWGKVLWYLSERAGFVQPAVLHMRDFSRLDVAGARTLLLTASYLSVGLAGAGAFSVLAGLPLSERLALVPRDAGLVLLGIVAEVSICNLIVSLYVAALGPARVRFEEIAEIPWIAGLRGVPPAGAVGLAAGAAAVEELFFRGVVLLVLLELVQVPAAVAIVVAGLLFWLQQVLQVRTRFQAVIISGGCVAISAIGGLLVVATGSVTPSVICHAAFVVFFLRPERSGGRAR